jgi:hypothetical protein
VVVALLYHNRRKVVSEFKRPLRVFQKQNGHIQHSFFYNGYMPHETTIPQRTQAPTRVWSTKRRLFDGRGRLQTIEKKSLHASFKWIIGTSPTARARAVSYMPLWHVCASCAAENRAVRARAVMVMVTVMGIKCRVHLHLVLALHGSTWHGKGLAP